MKCSLVLRSASDNAFTGKIPSFIGNWRRLKSLRFQGNSFEGPIPHSFSNLISLESLQISDLSKARSTLDFVMDMKKLTDLNLRNALIDGSIPSEIGDFPSLNRLDLSFNNLTGPIPQGLFSMSSLKYLFLGNNNLFGPLPSQKSSMLQTMNLVANNFTFDSSNISILPGLNCLQRDFQCNRKAPHHTRFAINCGGPQMISADETVYEAENASLGAASFHVTNSEKWAASNVGLYEDTQSPSYILNNFLQVSNTNTPELFQTSRISPGSLRYYGLGLENGNYTINLMFAETKHYNLSEQTLPSLERRVFDIYVQGSCLLKDFDISKEAGGVEKAITRTFGVTVSDNHLEIHLYWAGKGTCSIPVQGYCGPTISALSVVPDFIPKIRRVSPGQKKNWTGLIVGISVFIGVVSLILKFGTLYSRGKLETDYEEDPRSGTFSYPKLSSATENFSTSNKLGEGGFGTVYKGVLSDGTKVAVKQLSVASNESNQGKREFLAEIATISSIRHRNIVTMYGYCIKGKKRLLVYEYLQNKSLQEALFGKAALKLDWPMRFKICLGTARGLVYLHAEYMVKILHGNMNSKNILLDAELCPKISDIGLRKLCQRVTATLCGSFSNNLSWGYVAPEWFMHGCVTEKTDIYSFGVVAMEILSGRRSCHRGLDNEPISLPVWARRLHESNQSLSMMDPSLSDFDENEALRVIGVALLCTQESPETRPTMLSVLAMLSGDIAVSSVTSSPAI